MGVWERSNRVGLRKRMRAIGEEGEGEGRGKGARARCDRGHVPGCSFPSFIFYWLDDSISDSSL